MGSAPQQKDAQGSGITIQRSGIPQDIQNRSQSAFRAGLDSTVKQTYGLTNNLPKLGQIGGFNPSAMNLQSSVNLQSRATPYEIGGGSLDPLVQAQLSQAANDRAGILNAQNQKLASSLGPGNQALTTALTSQNNLNAQLASGPERLAALEQQRGFNIQGAQLDLERMNQANQAALQSGQFTNQTALQDRQAQESAFGINANATQVNNQAALNEFQSRAQVAQLGQGLLQNLGQGLIATAPQLQGQFTMADLAQIAKTPELINAAVGNLPAGLVPNEILGRTGTLPPKTTQIQTDPVYVKGAGWTVDGGRTFTNGKPRVSTNKQGGIAYV